jgi:hypothetical protein
MQGKETTEMRNMLNEVKRMKVNVCLVVDSIARSSDKNRRYRKETRGLKY